MQVLSNRTMQKARFLAEDGRVVKVGDGVWAVEASTIYVGSYLVTRTAYGGLECECKSYAYRRDCCHVRAVALLVGEEALGFEPEEGGESEDDPWQRLRY